MAFNDYEAVIGLEIHVQLATKSKLFCSDSTEFGSADNDHICPVCTAMPGALPVMNERALEYSVRTGLALGCKIRERSVFARKQYFYPDLPKGYQISQYDLPLCEHGHLEFVVNGEKKNVSITRAHMEEDAGKSTHHGDYSLINLNRAGIPLLEIVSGPDMTSPAEAAEYARTMRNIVRYLGVCDGNLEEGSLRCDCNVSVRKRGETKLGTKVEIKNINSFRFIEKAIEYEIHRQIDCKETGEPIYQETRLYDPDKNRTFSMRTKEDAHDYRYFPDPDLLTIEVEPAYIEKIRKALPELPLARAARFMNDYKLPEYDAMALTNEKDLADYFERAVVVGKNAKAVSNWIMTDLVRELNESKTDVKDSPLPAERLGQMIALIENGTISGKIAKTVFTEMWATGKEPDAIVKEKGLGQITDTSAIEAMIDSVIAANPNELEQYRSGKEKVFGFFVGQAMKASKGQASPELVNGNSKDEVEGLSMRVAALDLGTNTFLLLVADIVNGRIEKVVHDEVRVVRLGQGVNQSRSFHPEALIRANDCLKDFGKMLQDLGAESVLACATSAARDVKNGNELLKIGATHGIPIDIISGEREAELTFWGTVPDDLSGDLAIIDVGGGSTEFIIGDKSGIRARRSVDIGSVRMTEMFVTQHPVPSNELANMKSDIDQKLSGLAGHIHAQSSTRVIAVAGTPTTIATLDQGLPFESERVNGHRLSLEGLNSWVTRLSSMTVEERQKLAGMEPKRADVIVAGTLILLESAKALGARELEVSVRGLRYGLAKSLAANGSEL